MNKEINALKSFGGKKERGGGGKKKKRIRPDADYIFHLLEKTVTGYHPVLSPVTSWNLGHICDTNQCCWCGPSIVKQQDNCGNLKVIVMVVTN